MILLFANSLKKVIGGVEIFNRELEILLNNNNINCLTVSKDYYIGNKFIDIFYRAFWALYLVFFKYNDIKSIIVQHSSFFDILVIPILSISLKPIYTIHHVGKDWKHIQNKLSLFIINLILSMFVKKIFVINEEQWGIFITRKKERIFTIINSAFNTIPKLRGNMGKYILYLGRICKNKGIEDLILAYSNSTLKNKINIILVGPIQKMYKNYLVNLLKSKNLLKFIIIKSPIYNVKDKIYLIDNCIFGVYPSYKDAFPLTVIEFFSRKKICIATKIAETNNFISYDDFLFIPGSVNELKYKMEKVYSGEYNKLLLDNIYMKAIKYSQGIIIKDLRKYNVI